MEEEFDAFALFLDCVSEATPATPRLESSTILFDAEAVAGKMRRWETLFDMDYTWEFNVERWIDRLGDLTLHSSAASVALTPQNMEFLCGMHQAWCEHRLPGNGDWPELWEDERISDFHSSVGKVLRERGEDFEAFIRLSSRSPKDAIGGLRPCTTASQVLLRLALSERAYHDMSWAVLNRKKLALWIFPWREGVGIEREFRCFVFGGKLTAITSYTERGMWKNPLGMSTLVTKARLLAQTITNRLPRMQNYVMDVFCDISDVRLIELNPWGSKGSTDAVLFHWTEDQAVLEDSSSVTFRYRSSTTEVAEVAF